jgi:uncharacterized membrane protein YcaP (DUF421 family)
LLHGQPDSRREAAARRWGTSIPPAREIAQGRGGSVIQETWDNLIGLDIPTIEKIIRPIVVYLVLIVLFRIFGRRELAQLNPMDLAVLLMLASALENAIIGEDESLIGGIYGAVALLSMNWLVNAISYRHSRVEKLLEGEPKVLIKQGVVNHDVLRGEKISESDIREALHREGIERVEAVRLAHLEPSGQLTIIPEEDRRLDELMERLDRIEALRAAKKD